MGGLAYVEADTNADILTHLLIGRLAHLGPQMTGLGVGHGKIGSAEKWRGRAYERDWELHQINSQLIELMELPRFKIDCNEPDALRTLMKWENTEGGGDPLRAKPIPWADYIFDMIDDGVKRAIGCTLHLQNNQAPMEVGLPLTDYKKVVESTNWRVEYGCRNQLVYAGRIDIPQSELLQLIMKKGGAEEFVKTVGSTTTFILMNEYTEFGRGPLGPPLCYGRSEKGTIAICSETRALDMVGFKIKTFRHVPPGSVGIIKNGKIRIKKVVDLPYCPCSFLWDYTGRPDSHIDGVSIRKVRMALGKALAEEVVKKGLAKPDDFFINDAIVTYPPRSPYYQARGFAQLFGTKVTEIYNQVLFGREYYQGAREDREGMSQEKLKFKENIKELVEGKDVWLLDDSIVSGAHMRNNSKNIKDNGARKVNIAIASPNFVSECPFGAYVPPKRELAAITAAKELGISSIDVYDNTTLNIIAEQIRKDLSVDSVTFVPLSIRKQIFSKFNSVFGNLGRVCNYCFGEPVPVEYAYLIPPYQAIINSGSYNSRLNGIPVSDNIPSPQFR